MLRLAGWRDARAGRDEESDRAHRTESADRGERLDPGFESAVVQGGQGTQGRGERRLDDEGRWAGRVTRIRRPWLRAARGDTGTAGLKWARLAAVLIATGTSIGPMARTVSDVAMLDSVITNEPIGIEAADLVSLKIGVSKSYFFENLEPEVAASMDLVLDMLSRAGVELVYSDLESINELNQRVGFPIVIYETKRDLQEYLAAYVPGTSLDDVYASVSSPDVKRLMTLVVDDAYSSVDYQTVLNKHRPQLQQLYASYFEDNNIDVVVFPTTPLSARRIDGSEVTVELNGEQVPTFATYIRNTDPGSNAGIPGLSIPMKSDLTKFPVGVEIDGPAWSDRRLLSIGVAIEQLLGENGF